MKKTIAPERPKNKLLAAYFLLCLCLLSLFPILTDNAQAEEKSIIISAVQTSGTKSTDDFIELYNNTCDDIDLEDWILKRRTSSGSESVIGSLKDTIPGKGHYLWKNIKEDLSGNPDYSTTSYSISSDYSIALFDPNGEQVASLTWGNNLSPFSDNPYYPLNPVSFEAILHSISDEVSTRMNYLPKNSAVLEIDSLSSCPIDDSEPEEEIESEETLSYSDQLRLNEILPNPKGDEASGEYIELYNDSDSSIDLKDWILKDSSKTKFVFPAGHILKPNEHLTIYRDTFKFALNNTGSEEVFLLDPEENIISETNYENAKENISFSFDGADWKWSKYLTPDRANRFGTSSKIRIEKMKEGYVGIPVEFALDPKYDNFSKVTWDFGNKKKSYLKNPTHTYLKKGKYKIKISASGETEDVSDSFTLKIKDYPRENVEIVSLLPNPFGSDAGQEWIEIRNNAKEVVNLKGWKLAAGQKTLINHPIKNDLEINPGETIQLTRENAFFTLHNTGMTLELHYPDGKTADKVTYAKTKIADDEIYIKEETGWIWFSTEEDVGDGEVLDFEEAGGPAEPEALPKEDSQGEVLGVSTELGKFSPSEEWEDKKRNRLHYLNYGLHVKLAYDFSNKIYPNNSLSAKSLPAHAENEAFLEINAFLNKLFFN